MEMALFAGAETQLLPDMTSDRTSHATVHKSLRVLSYSGLLVGLGGTICAMLLLDMLGDLRVRLICEGIDLRGDKIGPAMSKYGMGRRWRFCQWHFILSTFVGSLIIFIQVGMMAYLDEPLRFFVGFPVVGFILFAAAPLLFVVFDSMLSEQHGEMVGDLDRVVRRGVALTHQHRGTNLPRRRDPPESPR
jgi:hypothetical protein